MRDDSNHQGKIAVGNKKRREREMEGVHGVHRVRVR